MATNSVKKLVYKWLIQKLRYILCQRNLSSYQQQLNNQLNTLSHDFCTTLYIPIFAFKDIKKGLFSLTSYLVVKDSVTSVLWSTSHLLLCTFNINWVFLTYRWTFISKLLKYKNIYLKYRSYQYYKSDFRFGILFQKYISRKNPSKLAVQFDCTVISN